ncbi:MULTISPECIES: hypothetical protein [unclassified Sphingomonas]|uniref:hypothetical protein n=1 Tax=unclassified Sphingomonas TaxID=196159 RepID=UPI0008352C33|nr:MULTISPECIES: hypothetical protein [unclassified Sphingomonas]
MIILPIAFALQAAAQVAALETQSVEVTQTELDAMTDFCNAPRHWLRHLGGEEVAFQPSPEAEFEKVDCVLKRLRASIIPTKLGFVGNEEVPEEK